MSKAMIVFLSVMGVGFVTVCILAMTMLGWMNTANGLEKRYTAQQMVVETTMDNMRKTLMSQYAVSKDFADTFIKVVAMNAEGRKGGSIFKSVTESSGNVVQGFNPELASKMMNSIEGKMAEFTRAQNVWGDVWREYETYLSTQPQGLFLSMIGRKSLPKPIMITSSVAKEAMETGKLDDDILGRKK